MTLSSSLPLMMFRRAITVARFGRRRFLVERQRQPHIIASSSFHSKYNHYPTTSSSRRRNGATSFVVSSFFGGNAVGVVVSSSLLFGIAYHRHQQQQTSTPSSFSSGTGTRSLYYSSCSSSSSSSSPRSPPPRFGKSILDGILVGRRPAIRNQHYSTTTTTRSSSSTTSNSTDASSFTTTTSSSTNDDCPLCRKYSRGPCGHFFVQWLECTEQFRTDNYKNDDDDNNTTTGTTSSEKNTVDSSTRSTTEQQQEEALYVSKCQHLATPLAECLEEHKEYYDSINIYYTSNDDDMDDDDESLRQQQDDDDLQAAWNEVIQQIENEVNNDNSSITHVQHFPSHLDPRIEIRPLTNIGMAAFVVADNDDDNDDIIPLTLCYVKDDDTNEVLAAASLQDLKSYGDENYGVLRLHIPDATRSITAFGLYDNVLYSKTLLVPPTS